MALTNVFKKRVSAVACIPCAPTPWTLANKSYMNDTKKKSLIFKSAILVIVFSVCGSYALYKITHPKNLNHIVIINNSPATLKDVTVNYSHASFSQNYYLPEIEPLELQIENVETLFARPATVTVSFGGNKISKEISSVGRYGHAMIISLGLKNVYVSYDSIKMEQ